MGSIASSFAMASAYRWQGSGLSNHTSTGIEGRRSRGSPGTALQSAPLALMPPGSSLHSLKIRRRRIMGRG
eukprot:3784541-Pyramimonas_sp.AAC.1